MTMTDFTITGLPKEQADRLKACFNACQGFQDPEREIPALVNELNALTDAVRKMRSLQRQYISRREPLLLKQARDAEWLVDDMLLLPKRQR